MLCFFQPFCSLIQIHGHNRARQRDKLGHILEEFATLQDEVMSQVAAWQTFLSMHIPARLEHTVFDYRHRKQLLCPHVFKTTSKQGFLKFSSRSIKDESKYFLLDLLYKKILSFWVFVCLGFLFCLFILDKLCHISKICGNLLLSL